jgi:fructose-1,6-bisphosphatase I
METALTLPDHLAHFAAEGATASSVATVVETIAATALDLSQRIGLGPLSGIFGSARGRNADGDTQKDIDVEANAMFREAMRRAPVAAFASEEEARIEILDAEAPLAVAIDPVDGSGNIDVNMPVGTIFSIAPRPAQSTSEPDRFAWAGGREQLAAGFVLYGPQTTLVLSLGNGVDMFTLDRRRGVFVMTARNLRVPAEGPDEYAINASNYRHWEEPIRGFVDDCVAGAEGPLGRDFNMRWHGALVAEAFRILTRGGIYLYPADARGAYRSGRLRLIYEAYPIAFLMEQAGGRASTGRVRILDLVPEGAHQRVPLIFGSATKVARIEELHVRPGLWPTTSAPLFATRGLFRV